MKRIRISRPRTRRERPWEDDLPADPRDPDIVRAKRKPPTNGPVHPEAAARN